MSLNAEAYLFREEVRPYIRKAQWQPVYSRCGDDDYLEGNVDAGEGGTMFLSIPYDKGWTATVDGNPGDASGRCLNLFRAGVRREGYHCSLTYMLEGLKMELLQVYPPLHSPLMLSCWMV